MKRVKIIVLLSLLVLMVQAQQTQETKHNKWDFASETAVSAGLGIGGNSAFGTELQLMFLPKLSAQLGAGIGGFSGGLNYHVYPTVRSPYFSLQIWQQGYGNKYKAAYTGPMFVYRAEKWFQAGLGVGYRINKNPDVSLNSKLSLMFNLGIYIPAL